jgi:hypothetical protein
MRDSYETTAEQYEESERRDELRRSADDDERFAKPDPTKSFASIAIVHNVYDGERTLRDVFGEPTREEIAAELKRGGPQARLSLAMSILMRRIADLTKREARSEHREAS